MFFALIFTLKEKRQHKSEKEFENEEKRKSAVTFVTALFFLVGTLISSISFRMDVIGEGLGEMVVIQNVTKSMD
jgi:hypothetical protein